MCIKSMSEHCLIKKNTPELRKKLEDAGLSVCICTTFEDADNPIIANMDNYFVRENRVVLIRTIISTIIYSFTKQSSNQLNNQPNNF